MNSSIELEYLPDYFCSLIDLPPGRKDCSQQYPQLCITCNITGKFITGEILQDYYSTGHLLCLFMWAITVLVGLLGILNNILIILIFRQMKTYRPFHHLLMVLSGFDLLSCASVLATSTVHVAIYQNWIKKDVVAMYWYFLGTSALILGRTGSTFMAMMITIERFLIIKFPLLARVWFTARKTTLLVYGTLLGIAILNIPRFICYQVEQNRYKEESIASIQKYEHLITATRLHILFYDDMHDAHTKIDFWLPLPILILFNLLSYAHMKEANQQRKKMNVEQKNEIQALNIFLPVVVVLFVTNIVPIIFYVSLVITRNWYRELSIAVGLAIAVNSASNFFIYFYRGSNFRDETKMVLSKWLGYNLIEQREIEKATTNVVVKKTSELPNVGSIIAKVQQVRAPVGVFRFDKV
ncbi:unnamed protein product [Orchesella dallaii]|uniref:G-protein coupled receptors family 1 profile domain-containing protein n=1 Tax=Orchesella dallaii TaxID=48710 RepID=A0ABP1S713_9HEXA